MTPNPIKTMPEFEGSQEFREILSTLVQERPKDSLTPAVANRRDRDHLRIWLGRMLLALGLTLLGLYGAARFESLLSLHAALDRFDTIAAASKAESNQSGGNLDPSRVDFSLWDGRRVRAYEKSLNAQFGAPLAVLRISKIGLEVPLLDGTNGLTLNHAVGRIPGTAQPGEPGNIGIAGHRDGFFRGLKDVGIGDTIDLEAAEESYTYVVDEINIVSPDDVNVLRPRSAPSLTLVTCYPFHFIGSAPQRFVIHASRRGFEPQKYNSTEQGSLTLAHKNQEKTQ
jgi:sortase A